MHAGPWTVEAVHLRGRTWLQVKYHGSLHGGGAGWQRGLYASIEEVAEVLGPAFAELQAEPDS